MKLEAPPSHHIPHLLTKLKMTPRKIVTPPVNYRERFPTPRTLLSPEATHFRVPSPPRENILGPVPGSLAPPLPR
ncbi:unnamed protein product [Phytomonas sp. EM1]|nr:unnamed protein product [Phytomonas sp. EM1]|eukprot:CCW64581.1 unnamed protein product [Phytomonas sp. isolate EM1]